MKAIQRTLKLCCDPKTWGLALVVLFISSCMSNSKPKTAEQILGNPDYPAIAFGGYRNADRSQAPSVEELKEDVRILHAAGFRILRTYHARLYGHAENLLKAIEEVKAEEAGFEMYVMLGAWMQCAGAWTDNPQHNVPDAEENDAEIAKAIELANSYPDIVKVVAVGNESMVHWAATYYVHPSIILKEVNYLQALKVDGKLPVNLWITSSDNFASWGGEGPEYHLPALDSLIRAVDYLSVHVYPFHDTHYNPDWWWTRPEEEGLSREAKIEASMQRGLARASAQVEAVKSYLSQLGVEKPIHIGETGWASADNHLYGADASGAADEYKQAWYYAKIKAYCATEGMACFYFEAFDEPWKDGDNPGGSENHFGLFTVDGVAKMPVWNLVDQELLAGLSRGGKAIRKSLDGDSAKILMLAGIPTLQADQPALRTQDSTLLNVIDSDSSAELVLSQVLTLNPWEGTCGLKFSKVKGLEITTGTGEWWGGSLDLKQALDLSAYEGGTLELLISGNSQCRFQIGFQSGSYGEGNQKEAVLNLGPGTKFKLLSKEPQLIKVPIRMIKAEANLKDVRAPLYIKGIQGFDGKGIRIHRFAYRS